MADENGIKVPVTVTDNTQSGLAGAEQEIAEFGERVENGFERVAARIADYFAIEKIAEFAKSSVEEFANVERAMDLLGVAIQRAGGDWRKSKDGVESFIESEERLSGFTKEQLLQSLNDAVTKIGDLKMAMTALDDATKLSMITGQDMRTTVDAVSLAVQGNSRGLMELGRILGLSRDQAKDANVVFATMQEKISGIGSVTGDTKGRINDLSTSWTNFSESVGSTLSGILPLFSFLLKLVNTIWEIFVDFLDTIVFLIESIGQLAVAFVDSIVSMIQGVGRAKDAFFELKAVFKSIGDTEDESNKQIQKNMDKIWGEGTATYTLELNKRLGAHSAMLIKEEADEKLAAEQKKKALEDEEKETAEMLKKKARAVAEALKKEEEETKKTFDTIGKGVEGVAEKVGKAFTEVGKKGKDIAKDMAKALVESGADAIAKLLELQADLHFAQAAADAVSFNYAGAADEAIAGALLDAAAGAIKGVAGAMDQGGIVTQPTLTWVGEKRPEAVIPLEEAGKYGIGGGSGETHINGGIHLNFPNVQSANDFKRPGVMQSIARQLSTHIQSMNSRQGLRQTGGAL